MNPTVPIGSVPGLRVRPDQGKQQRKGQDPDAFRRALQQEQQGKQPVTETPTAPALQPRPVPVRKNLPSTARHVDVVA